MVTAVLSHPDQLKELLGIPFNREQVAAIGAPLRPAVIVAGAGSGKTTVMAARVVWLVGSGAVRPEQVLGLTFTNKAAGELAERVRAALRQAGVGQPPADGDWAAGPDGEALGEPEISTYHAFAGRLLKEHGLRIGIEPDVRLLADATRFQLAAKVLRTARGPFPALTGTFTGLVADLTALDGELAEHLVTPERLRAHDEDLLDALAGVRLSNEDLRAVPAAARARLELLRLVEDYRRRKSAAGLMDFGDQIAAAARLAQQRPEVGALLRDQYRVVLLDEYQDTSVAQRLMLAGLFGAGPDGPAPGHPVTAVGDPCQAIYGWRGASVANLDDFPRHFPAADGTPADRYALSENRRSGGRLLALANGLAAPLRAMHEGVEALRPAPAPNSTAGCGPRCCPPTPRRSTGSPTRSPTWCAPAPPPAGSPCCAGAARPSPTCTPRWSPARCRSRWSASAGCSTCPRWPTWSRCARCSRTRPPTPRWCGC